MSLQFSDTTNKNGIIQHIERMLGFNDGDISGNATRLAHFTSDVNLALDNVLHLIFSAGGTWNFDDTNHTDYPIITANLTSGQQDYTLTEDGSSNLVLEIHKVMAKDSDGTFKTLEYVDQQAIDQETDDFANGLSGTPTKYDRTATGIFLDKAPTTSISGGLRIYISREGSYFSTSDTTKKPGIAGIFHRYFVLHASDNYAMMHGLSNRRDIQEEKLRMEQDIRDHYGRRSRDEKPRMRPKVESTR